ncbi:MAG: DNA-binding winged helix-turn-helix (wHTH) protein/Tol biopolymer transport system component [Flavobacteriales bacterium]
MYQVGSWKVIPEESKISSENSDIQLTSLSMAILCCLIAHKGGIVSKAKLIEECWNGRFVSDDAVRQAIKELRGHLGCNSKQPSYIETIRKQGYRLLPEALVVDEEITPIVQPTKNHMKFFVSVAAFFLLSLSIFLLTYDQKPTFELADDFTIVTFNKRVESEYVVSSLNWDAYSLFKPKTITSDKIIIRNKKKHVIHEISPSSTSEDAYVRLPSFSPDGKKLAYLDYSPNACKINIISIDNVKMESLNEIKCTETDGYVAIEWKNNQSIYYSTSVSMAVPLALKLIDLSTSELTQITNPVSGGRGDHQARLCSNGDLLILRSIDWSNSQLVIYDPVQNKEVLHKNIPGIINAADWSDNCNQIVLAIKSNPLAIYDLVTEQLVYLNDFYDIDFLDENNGFLYLTEGDWFNYSISSVNLNTKLEKEIVSSNRSNSKYTPKPYSSDFAFVSNRTGRPQIWLKSNNEYKQLTFFKDYKKIKYLTWSLKGDRLVYFSKNTVYQFNILNDQLSMLFKPKGEISSLIPLSENKWLFSTFFEGNWFGYMYDELESSMNLHSNQPIQVFFKNFNNEIYFSTAQREIYRYNLSSLNHKKISRHPGNTYDWQALNNFAFFVDYDQNIYKLDNTSNKKQIILENFDVNFFQFIDKENIIFSKIEDGKVDVKKYKYTN